MIVPVLLQQRSVSNSEQQKIPLLQIHCYKSHVSTQYLCHDTLRTLYMRTQYTTLFVFGDYNQVPSLIILAHQIQNPNISHLRQRATMESRNQGSEHHDDMECPHTLSHFITNAPLEGDFYRQIRGDIAECDRLGVTISPQIIDHDAYLNLLSQSSDWRRMIENFQRTLQAFAPAEELLDHASGPDISNDLEMDFYAMEHQIDGFCEDVRKYKYRISRIIRLPLYVHCLTLSEHLDLNYEMSFSCTRYSRLAADIPRVGVYEQEVDNDTLLKHLTDLHRVDSVVKEWMFMAKTVKSAISIKTVGWDIDHVKLFTQIRHWNSERRTSEQSKEMQEALEEATKQKDEVQEMFDLKCDEVGNFRKALDDATQREDKLWEALDQANKQQDEMQKALEQAVMRAKDLDIAMRVSITFSLVMLLAWLFV